jgi:hypothetical protein
MKTIVIPVAFPDALRLVAVTVPVAETVPEAKVDAEPEGKTEADGSIRLVD